MGDPLGDQRRPFAAKPPPVLLFRRGRHHHRADPRLAALVGETRRQQRLAVKPIRLGAPAPPRRRDRSGIDHMTLNAVLLQSTVQPEPVQPSFLDRDDRIALAGPGRRLAPEVCEQLHQAGNIAGRDAMLEHLLAFARRKRRYQPIRTTQFQRHKNCAKLRADSGRSVGRMIEQHRCLQVEWFLQPQSGFRLGRYALPMESSSLCSSQLTTTWLLRPISSSRRGTSLTRVAVVVTPRPGVSKNDGHAHGRKARAGIVRRTEKMLNLVLALLAGVVTIAAPCTLPVLPSLLGASVGQTGKIRPAMIALGFVISFSATALLLSSITRIFDFDPNHLRTGAAVLLLGFV